jgi:hypothetical protein
MNKSKLVCVRVPADLAERLVKATGKRGNPYPPTNTAIMLRGLELALREIEKKGAAA